MAVTIQREMKIGFMLNFIDVPLKMQWFKNFLTQTPQNSLQAVFNPRGIADCVRDTQPATDIEASLRFLI